MLSLDELVFEYRNKEYGAYKLRKNHNRNLLIATIIVFGSIGIYLGISSYLQFKADMEDLKNMGELTKDMDMIYFELEPPPKPPKPPELTIEVSEMDKMTIPEVVDSTYTLLEKKPLIENLALDSLKSIEKKKDSIELAEKAKAEKREKIDEDDIKEPPPVDNQKPMFEGGDYELLRFIQGNLKYPKEAISNKITGVVQVSFRIRKSGKVDRIIIEKGIHPLLDSEAVRVIRLMPKWQPCVKNGKYVNVLYSLPIHFSSLK